jgi:hypothetical protein
MDLEQPWIGLVHVQPKKGKNPLGPGLKGAYTHVIALAADLESYKDRACKALEREGLCVIEISDVSPVEDYRSEGRIDDNLEDLVSILSPEYPVQFDAFDAYFEHDA